MHKIQFKIKAFVVSLLFVIPATLGLAAAHQTEANSDKATVVVKQASKISKENVSNDKDSSSKDKAVKAKKKTKKLSKKELEAQRIAEEKAKEAEAKRLAEEEAKKEAEKKKAAALTPDKKKYASPSGYQVTTDGRVVNFRSMGVIHMHGYRYTYYSSKVLYHHRTPEWYACDDNIYRTADGYVVVASGAHPKGSIVPTPFGPGKVLDYCHVGGTIDIYVNF